MDYSHIFCTNCSDGLIGWRGWSGDNSLMCDKCGTSYGLYDFDYDCIQINCRTGWGYPMVCECSDEVELEDFEDE